MTRRPRNLFRDESGFTTTSMVLSLLITLALLFTSAQVYRINSASAEVQDVADSAALSAENQVAEFMIVARFCDATVLSLSLSGIAAFGLGIVALCTPATATLSEGLIDAGKGIIRARDDFAGRAQRALDKLQEALPFYSAACAASVAMANDEDSSGARYLGIALLVPSEGDPVSAEMGEGADELTNSIDESADDIREKAREAEEAVDEANEAKAVAFAHDCGDNPGYCMYERAAHLIGLSGADNPLYSSIDAWSFSVALNRAQRYYSARASNDEPTGSSPGDLARWHLRINFYEYAADALDREGYVRESESSFEANFPHLPRNTSEMRETDLYTSKVYPITEEPADEGDPMPVMHVWSECPGATGAVTEHESIAYMESANLSTCPVCEFTAASMGKVAAASTSIENGFEHHYEVVAQQAKRYQEALEKAGPAKDEVESKVEGLFDELVDALKEAADKRISVSPPGKFGAIALVVNMGTTPASGGLVSAFAASGSLGPRAALSASTLVDEGSDEGRTVINSMLDGLREDGGVAVGAVGIALDLWSRMLSAYSQGVDALIEGVESGLSQLPLASASGLGTWASTKLRNLLDDVGLEPAELEALKPVLVNSAHVASKDEGDLGANLIATKQHIISHPFSSTDLFASLLSDGERSAIEGVHGLGDSVEIASIELLGDGGPSIPITIPLPEAAKEHGVASIQSLFGRIRSLYAEVTGVRTWE